MSYDSESNGIWNDMKAQKMTGPMWKTPKPGLNVLSFPFIVSMKISDVPEHGSRWGMDKIDKGIIMMVIRSWFVEEFIGHSLP